MRSPVKALRALSWMMRWWRRSQRSTWLSPEEATSAHRATCHGSRGCGSLPLVQPMGWHLSYVACRAPSTMALSGKLEQLCTDRRHQWALGSVFAKRDWFPRTALRGRNGTSAHWICGQNGSWTRPMGLDAHAESTKGDCFRQSPARHFACREGDWRLVPAQRTSANLYAEGELCLTTNESAQWREGHWLRAITSFPKAASYGSWRSAGRAAES